MARQNGKAKTCITFARVKSPVGEIVLACKGDALCALEFADAEKRMVAWLGRRFGDFERVEAADPGGVCTRLGAYLLGDLEALDDIVVDGGGTEFQRKVWKGLRRVAAGKVVSYQGLAERLGMPNSVRAVARANALNPISIVVPCHRVIGSDGSLTGYGGGLPRKRWLLEHEGVVLPVVGAKVRWDRRYPAPGPRP
ncbi:MAG TPA: methylated-DNA--[protein]-cysteine S-methyltransferase [Stellaceae bacterium]|nr:methylated-DNA--[protein]-cysteine S-methyltransferase [Stellaceae bacterium]